MPAPRSIRNRTNKFEKNVQKRGNVSVGKAGDHEEERTISPKLIAFFMFVVIGSSFVQVLNLFKGAKPPLGEDESPMDAEP